MSKLFAAALAVASLTLVAAGPAPAPPSPDGTEARQCFYPQAIRNYRTENDTTAYVRDLRGQVFEIQSSGCRGLTASRSLAISPVQGGRACVGGSVTVATSGPSLRSENNSVCAARVTRRLSEAELEALPTRLRP